MSHIRENKDNQSLISPHPEEIEPLEEKETKKILEGVSEKISSEIVDRLLAIAEVDFDHSTVTKVYNEGKTVYTVTMTYISGERVNRLKTGFGIGLWIPSGVVYAEEMLYGVLVQPAMKLLGYLENVLSKMHGSAEKYHFRATICREVDTLDNISVNLLVPLRMSISIDIPWRNNYLLSTKFPIRSALMTKLINIAEGLLEREEVVYTDFFFRRDLMLGLDAVLDIKEGGKKRRRIIVLYVDMGIYTLPKTLSREIMSKALDMAIQTLSSEEVGRLGLRPTSAGVELYSMDRGVRLGIIDLEYPEKKVWNVGAQSYDLRLASGPRRIWSVYISPIQGEEDRRAGLIPAIAHFSSPLEGMMGRLVDLAIKKFIEEGVVPEKWVNWQDARRCFEK